jgi:hypothetical protein
MLIYGEFGRTFLDNRHIVEWIYKFFFCHQQPFHHQFFDVAVFNSTCSGFSMLDEGYVAVFNSTCSGFSMLDEGYVAVFNSTCSGFSMLDEGYVAVFNSTCSGFSMLDEGFCVSLVLSIKSTFKWTKQFGK